MTIARNSSRKNAEECVAGVDATAASRALRFDRCSGVLLHPTSLASRFGIGDFGPSARAFADFLQAAKQRVWHILPFGPTGDSFSPYQSCSTFAGNLLLVSPELLADRGYFSKTVLRNVPRFPADHVNFSEVAKYKRALLEKAFHGFTPDAEFRTFEKHNASWLECYAKFMALREANGLNSWTHFDKSLQPEPRSVAFHKFAQFEFFSQWDSLRQYARSLNVRMMGDMPFYVQHDSADVWARPDYFDLAPDGSPRTIGGVPPDAFSDDGQSWGNPTYRWDRMERDGFAWWIARFRATLERVGILRIDHFRGFESYWEIPADAPNAKSGRWVKAPGAELFRAVSEALGDLPVVAENLGVITPEVEELRNEFSLPGMAVLQFAFDSDNVHRPYNFERNTVAFTGTHDNNTSRGWWAGLQRAARKNAGAREQLAAAAAFLQTNGRHVHWNMIRAVINSVAQICILPAQDVLGLGASARMNVPGVADGNWVWRALPGAFTPELAERLASITEAAGRARDADPIRGFVAERARQAQPEVALAGD
jgi:4-alpha-glucanotransferase